MTDRDTEYRVLLSRWLKGNPSAIAFIEMVCQIAHTCDDLTDQDTNVEVSQIQDTFWKALIELPRNSFYVESFALLNGTVQMAFLNWKIANQLERTNAAQAQEVAFILRSSYIDLVTLSAWIIGVTDWACQVGEEARLETSQEGLDAYRMSLTKERRGSHVVMVP